MQRWKTLRILNRTNQTQNRCGAFKMRQILYILIILFLLNSCKSKPKEKVTENSESSAPTIAVDYDSNFNEWLSNQDLERKMIVDTIKERAFELWAYGIILLDSLKQRSIDFYWYDSTSFFFIENEGANGEKYLTKLKMGINTIWTYKIEK